MKHLTFPWDPNCENLVTQEDNIVWLTTFYKSVWFWFSLFLPPHTHSREYKFARQRDVQNWAYYLFYNAEMFSGEELLAKILITPGN